MIKYLMLAELSVDTDPPTHTVNFGSVETTINQMPLAPLKPESAMNTDGSPRLLYHVPRPGHRRKEKKQLHAIPYDWVAHYSTMCHLCPNQEPWCWVLGHHCGKGIGEEVEERVQMVWGLGRSPVADPER